MNQLVQLMSAASHELKASMAASRAAFDHNLTKGEAVEAAVRDFMRTYYPSSVGVGAGQVIDSRGVASTQLDVILYDALRTPLLFSDKGGEHQLVPSEGVIAAIEAKMVLKVGDIPKLVNSAQSLKSLDRSAYYVRDSLIVDSTTMYGQVWERTPPPPMYFVFAFEGPSLETVAEALTETETGIPYHRRIDLVCILDKGMVVNADPVGGGYDTVPGPGKIRRGHATAEHALFLFHILASRHILQMDFPPIALQRYIPDGFGF